MDLLIKNRSLILWEGVLLIILGILAIALPNVFTLGLTLVLGWLIIISGLVQGYHAFVSKEGKGFWGTLLLSLIYIIFGALLLAHPIQGMISLTLLLVFFFILDGISKIILGFELKPVRNWGWLVVSGILSLLLAFLIWNGWPDTAFWAIGLLVGINLLFYGLSLTSFASSLPKAE